MFAYYTCHGLPDGSLRNSYSPVRRQEQFVLPVATPTETNEALYNGTCSEIYIGATMGWTICSNFVQYIPSDN